MSYRRIEINLLPPELQPGPVVRSALIINITMILGTFFAIVLTASLSLYRYMQYIDDIAKTTQSIKSLESVREGYQQLQRIDAAVLNYGKVIGIASTDYIDMPVLLSHLSNIIPSGVYLTSVTNARAGNVTAVTVLDPNRSTFVSMGFNTSKHDVGQIISTLSALKADPVFSNCVLTNARLSSEQLIELSTALGMDVTFDLPLSESTSEEYNFFEFIIRAEVRRPINDSGMRVVSENLELFKANKPMPLSSDQVADQAAGEAAPGTNPPAADTPGVVGGPEGVTGQSNRGGN
jgi:hypothetical protein